MDLFARKRQPIDLSLGGVRIYTDDRLKVGQLLKMEFFAQDAPPVTYTAEVVWIVPLDVTAAARFDVGLKFLHLEPDALKMLVSVLGPLEDDRADDEPGHAQARQDEHDGHDKERKKDAADSSG